MTAPAPAGAVVGLYVDLVAHIYVGDVIATQTGRRYQVLAVRVQERGKAKGRQHLRVVVMDARDGDMILRPNGDVAAVYRISWYKRGKARRRA